jgi:hypothetical protein
MTLGSADVKSTSGIRAPMPRYFGLGKADPAVCSREYGRAAVQARDGAAVSEVAQG